MVRDEQTLDKWALNKTMEDRCMFLLICNKIQQKNKSGCFVSRSELSQTQLPFDVQNNWPAMTTVYNTQQPSKMLTTESRNVLIKWCNSNRSAKFPCQNLPEQVGLKELPCGSEIPQKRRALC